MRVMSVSGIQHRNVKKAAECTALTLTRPEALRQPPTPRIQENTYPGPYAILNHLHFTTAIASSSNIFVPSFLWSTGDDYIFRPLSLCFRVPPRIDGTQHR